MNFTTTLTQVLIMLIYALPGVILIKSKAVKAENISSFTRFLMFVCQPCLTMYSFNKTNCTSELLVQMGIVFVIGLLFMVTTLMTAYLLLKRKYEDARYRVYTAAMTFGNVGFFGVPLLEALLPDYPNAIAFSAVFIVAMNLISWTLGGFIISGNKKFISLKKMFLNPPMITTVVALPLFLFGIKLPTLFETPITTLAKTTTPLCMLILGMRLATISPKSLISDKWVIISSAVKLVIFPMLMYCLLQLMPLENYVKITLFILSCCPTASVVQTLSELYGGAPGRAACCVILSTLMAVLTIPLLLLTV